jgi:integrase/recombinase XerD
MLEDLFLSKRWIYRFREAPLGPYVDAFSDDLAGMGFARLGIRRAVSAVNRFGRWLRAQHLRIEDVSEETIARFRRRRWSSSCRHGEELLCRFLQRLRQDGLTPEPIPKPPTQLDQLEVEFRAYLGRERGLAPTTIQHYTAVARRLIVNRFGSDLIDLSALSIRDIRAFVSSRACRTSVQGNRPTLTALRGFLGFLYVSGRISTPLAEHVPIPPCWRYDPPPKWLSADDVNLVLQHCDRQSPIGKRDFAILMILARLGLRAGEIVSLQLDDIRWETGELSVCGKAKQRKRFPLTEDVGEALVAYLKGGRPPCGSRRVFLRTTAPRGALAGSAAVYYIVSRALARARLSPPCRGPHLFRHSLATTMMRRGATLTEIGQILHHQNPSTTAIYAKVDITGLRAIAMPWLGEDHGTTTTRT